MIVLGVLVAMAGLVGAVYVISTLLSQTVTSLVEASSRATSDMTRSFGEAVAALVSPPPPPSAVNGGPPLPTATMMDPPWETWPEPAEEQTSVPTEG